jgi:hypothetical protein
MLVFMRSHSTGVLFKTELSFPTFFTLEETRSELFWVEQLSRYLKFCRFPNLTCSIELLRLLFSSKHDKEISGGSEKKKLDRP